MNMDTSAEVDEMLFTSLGEAPAWRKWQLMAQLNRAARQLALSGLRRRHPDASPKKLQGLLANLLFGSELANRLYDFEPNDT